MRRIWSVQVLKTKIITTEMQNQKAHDSLLDTDST